MKYSFLMILALLSGCASVGDLAERNVSPAQNYRPAGSDKSISISGTMERTHAGFNWDDGNNAYDRTLRVYFNDQLTIAGQLSRTFTGELSGYWQEKPVSAACSSELVNPTWRDVRCIIFMENERTVTLTF